MYNFKTFLRIFCITSFLIIACANANANSHVSVIFSVAPPVMETYAPPTSYVECYEVPAAFYNGIWINTHRVCHYDDAPGHDVWISGYWGCTRYCPTGACLHWAWYPSHWMRDGYIEYGVHYHPHPHCYPYYHHYHDYHCYHHGHYYDYDYDHHYHHHVFGENEHWRH